MAVSINQITSGMGLLIDGSVYLVMVSKHVKPGKGGAFAKVKLKNMKTQQIVERTLRDSDKIEDVAFEEKKLQNLYRSGDAFHFMDLASFDQLVIGKNLIGDQSRFLQDSLEVTGICYNGNVLKVELPTFIIAEITHTEPGHKGDSTRAGTKPATIDTGTNVQVPLFVDIGDKIKVDTRTGEYVERVKK